MHKMWGAASLLCLMLVWGESSAVQAAPGYTIDPVEVANGTVELSGYYYQNAQSVAIPDAAGGTPQIMATVSIADQTGSDEMYGVYHATSSDLGLTWSVFNSVYSLARSNDAYGVPRSFSSENANWHTATGTILMKGAYKRYPKTTYPLRLGYAINTGTSASGWSGFNIATLD